MPFRLLEYMTELLRRLFNDTDKDEREKKGFRLPAIVPIIFFNGQDTWTAVKSFKEYLSDYEIFGKNVIDFEYMLLDLNHSDEGFILSTNMVLDNIFALDQKHKKEDTGRILGVVQDRYVCMNQQEQTDFMKWFEGIYLNRLPESNRDEILKSFKRGDKNMLMSGLDFTLENERMEGVKKGIEVGEKKAKVEIAERFLKLGLTIKEVVQGTELSEEEVMEIKARLKI